MDLIGRGVYKLDRPTDKEQPLAEVLETVYSERDTLEHFNLVIDAFTYAGGVNSIFNT